MEKNNDLWLERAAYIEKLEAELAAVREEIERLHFSWSGCSQQLKDVCQDLDEAEKQLASRDLVIKQQRIYMEWFKYCIEHQVGISPDGKKKT